MKYGWILAALPVGAALFLMVRHKLRQKTAQEELQAKEELLTNIKRFSGCFHPLFQAVQGENIKRAQKHLDIWKQQASGFEHLERFLDSLSRAEKSPLDSAASLMEAWECWGIHHDPAGSVFTIAREHEALYLFDDVYQPGDQARVTRPAWWVRTEDRLICIETGIAEIEYQE